MSTMVEILERIIATRGTGCAVGLCEKLYGAKDYCEKLVDSIFETWEHFSGCVAFPVPDPSAPGDPEAARRAFMKFEPYGGFLGEYGELRLKLAEHLLEALR